MNALYTLLWERRKVVGHIIIYKVLLCTPTLRSTPTPTPTPTQPYWAHLGCFCKQYKYWMLVNWALSYRLLLVTIFTDNYTFLGKMLLIICFHHAQNLILCIVLSVHISMRSHSWARVGWQSLHKCFLMLEKYLPHEWMFLSQQKLSESEQVSHIKWWSLWSTISESVCSVYCKSHCVPPRM